VAYNNVLIVDIINGAKIRGTGRLRNTLFAVFYGIIPVQAGMTKYNNGASILSDYFTAFYEPFIAFYECFIERYEALL
jgi:hypothetical protein